MDKTLKEGRKNGDSNIKIPLGIIIHWSEGFIHLLWLLPDGNPHVGMFPMVSREHDSVFRILSDRF